jgi:ferrous iron transport protein B
MNCHSGMTKAVKRDRLPRIVLLGMPNTGKSTFFNRITGSAAAVGNWPGMTVSFLQAQVKIDGKLTELVDLPGIYDLNGFSDDEKVVRHFLENFPIDLVVVIINALQIKALGLPAVVILIFPNGNGAIVLFSLYLLSFLAAIATAALFQGIFKNDEPFVL